MFWICEKNGWNNSLWMIFLNPKKKEKKKNADSTVGYKVSKKSQHQQNNSIG